MDRKRARAILASWRGAHICVVGDVMLDVFVRGRVARISPEAPVPVVEVDHEEVCLGGAGNVARNIAALGGAPVLIGLIGDDPAGDHLLQVARSSGLITDGLLRDVGRPTTVKSRIIAHSQQMIRVDRESRASVRGPAERRLLDRIRKEASQAAAVLVSDYAKGVVSSSLMRALRREATGPILVDPKVSNVSLYRGAEMVTPNLAEAALMSGIPIHDEASLARAGRRLQSRLRCPYLLVTRGEGGMTLFSRERGETEHIPARTREVYDVTGAGDTVIATLALARAAGATWKEAAELANQAAGIVVGHVGTAAVSPGDLIESFER